MEGFGFEVGDLETFGIKETADAGGEFVEVAFDPEAAGFGVGDKVYARGRQALGGGECGALAAGEVEEERFDMLAGAQAIDAEIRAGAGILRGGDVADFGMVGHPTGGMDFEVRKNGLGGVEVFDAEGFLASADAALENFVLVGCSPITRWWEFRGGVFFCGALHAGWGGIF